MGVVGGDAMNKWREINTLNCDGRLVLFWMSGGMFIGPATKTTPMSHEERLALVCAGYLRDNPWEQPEYVPTHYRELPEPPGKD